MRAAKTFELFVVAWVTLVWIVVVGCAICKILSVCCSLCGSLCNGAAAAVRRRAGGILGDGVIRTSSSAAVAATNDDDEPRRATRTATVASMVLDARHQDSVQGESCCPALLPTFEYSSRTHTRKMDCTVCLEEFKDGEKGRFLPACMHSFHAVCIDKWLSTHPTCPICGAVVYYSASDLDV